MVGRVGTVREPLDPDGMVFLEGALWQATSAAGALPADTPVRVVGVNGLRLRVEAVEQQHARAEGPQAASS